MQIKVSPITPALVPLGSSLELVPSAFAFGPLRLITD